VFEIPGDPQVSVLVVDDEPDHREMARARLEDIGLDVDCAASGEEALLKWDSADIVLLDNELPGISGLEVMEAMHVPTGPSVVLVSSVGSESLAVESLHSGAVDYAIKGPGFIDELPEIIQRAWRHHDVSTRASELQRMALLIGSATDKDGVLTAIVEGAQKLLRACGCALCLFEDRELRVTAHSGTRIDDVDKLLDAAEEAVASKGHLTQSPDDRLFVRLSRDDSEPLGVLVLFNNRPRVYVLEELTLAETFASFAILAIRNLQRLQLKENLVTELQRTLEMRRHFVDSVSHELRTPLSCINGFGGALASYLGDDDPVAQGYVTKLLKHSRDLALLIDQALDFTCIGRGRFEAHLQRFDLRALSLSIIESLQPLIAGRPCSVDLPEATVVADRDLLQRVYANLLSNAVKFSKGGSPIEIVGELEGTRARVGVTDHGAGLSVQQVDEVFEPFWRGPQWIRAGARGVGIGLFLCKQYIETMSGEISVTSELGAGSTFRFTLPLATR
jgi:signal transduction histidine kinase